MSEAANGVSAPSEPLMYATPGEITEFVERVRPRESQTRMTIVAVTETPPVEGPPCQWEVCKEPAVQRVRWRREAADGVNDAFDFAVYCDGHGMQAETVGAKLVERFK